MTRITEPRSTQRKAQPARKHHALTRRERRALAWLVGQVSGRGVTV